MISALIGIDATKNDGTKAAAGNTRSRVALSRHRDQRIIPLWLELWPLWALPEKISKWSDCRFQYFQKGKKKKTSAMFRGTKETLLIRWCSWCKSTAEKEEFAISAEEKKTRVSWAMVCVCFERQANIINIISFGGGYVFSLRSLKTRDQQRQPWRCLNYCSPVPSFQEWQEGRHRSADK